MLVLNNRTNHMHLDEGKAPPPRNLHHMVPFVSVEANGVEVHPPSGLSLFCLCWTEPVLSLAAAVQNTQRDIQQLCIPTAVLSAKTCVYIYAWLQQLALGCCLYLVAAVS
jgi:hypothetical protein